MGEPDRSRPWSLRSRVALAAALSAVVVAVVVAAIVAALLTHREVAALDKRLDVVAAALRPRVAAGADPQELLGGTRRPVLLRAAVGGLVVTARPASGPVTTGGLQAGAPTLPAVDGDVTADGEAYRVRTVALRSGGTLTVGLPEAETARTVAEVRRITALVTLAAAAAAAGLGWLLTGPATRPLRELRNRTAALSSRPGPEDRAALTTGTVGRTAETADLAEALRGLLDRVERARADGERALAAARDFAVAAEHELRTPLTALRTDIEVLAAHPDLPGAQRAEIVAQLATRQERIETTLTALAQLATGELTAPGATGPVELTDLVAQAVAGAARTAPSGVTIDAALPPGDVVVPGSAAGLRLALDNLLANAVRHSGGRHVRAAVLPGAGRVLVTVDDDGAGVPPDEREQVFARFRRGRSARGPGSGLGLALVAQQATLHGGTAALADSPMGGTRAVLELPANSGPTTPTGGQAAPRTHSAGT